MACYNHFKGWKCAQKSGYLDIYEDQIRGYLRSFRIHEDYQEKILEAHRKLRDACDDTDNQRARLEARLHRMKELYGWGDITGEQYLGEREAIRKELQALAPIEEQGKNLSKLAQFLANVADAWNEANQERTKKLARCLFQEVWIKDKEVVAVKPQPELKLFFDLNYEAMQEKLSQNFGKWRPRRASGYHAISGAWTLPCASPTLCHDRVERQVVSCSLASSHGATPDKELTGLSSTMGSIPRGSEAHNSRYSGHRRHLPRNIRLKRISSS